MGVGLEGPKFHDIEHATVLRTALRSGSSTLLVQVSRGGPG